MTPAMCTPRDSETAFPEKRAWIIVGTQILVFGAYFLLAPRPAGLTGMAIVERLYWFGGALTLQGVMVGVALSWLSTGMPRSERNQRDERDRAIDRRATSIAYFVLMIETIMVGVVMPFSHQGWEIVDASMASLIVAEAIRQIVIILGYRRGWHG